MQAILLLLGQGHHIVHVKQFLPPLCQVRWGRNEFKPLELAMVRQWGVIPGLPLAHCLYISRMYVEQAEGLGVTLTRHGLQLYA